MRIKKFLTIILSISIIIFTYSTIAYAYTTEELSANYVMQQKTNWCWSASAENAIRWEFSDVMSRDQSDAVKYIKGGSYNYTGTIAETEQAAEYISVNTESYCGVESTKGYLPLTYQINYGNCIILGAGFYTNGVRYGGHVVLMNGYYTSTVDYVYYYDPYTGIYHQGSYEGFCDGSYNGRIYDQTCFNTETN